MLRPLKSGSSCQKVCLIHYFIWLSIWKTALGYLSFATASDGIDDILPTHYTWEIPAGIPAFICLKYSNYIPSVTWQSMAFGNSTPSASAYSTLLFTVFPNWCEISLLALQPVSKLLFYELLCVSLDLVRPQRLGCVQPLGAPLGLQSISCFSICPSSRGSWQRSPDSLPCSAEDSLARSPWFWCLLLLLGSGTCWRNEVCSIC